MSHREPAFVTGLRSLRTLRGTAAVVAAAASLSSAQERELPGKGEPFPGFGGPVPYEDVLDHSAIVLVGRVLSREPYKASRGRESPEVPGRIRVEVQKVLRGEYTNRYAEIVYACGELSGVGDTNKPQAFICLRTSDCTLRLGGDPPDGGGHVTEGPRLIELIIEAARDPAQGYRSTNFVVKLSSAYRLARSWLEAPPRERPPPPPDLMETFLAGLRSYERQMGPNVDAVSWNGINALLGCQIRSIWDYPPEMKKGRRSKLADDVSAAWQRTKAAVRERRAERLNLPDADGGKTRAEVAALIERLGSEEYPERQAAHEAILKIGKPALKQVQEGGKNQDPRIAAGCRLLALLIGQFRDYRPDEQSHVFDLDRAEPFVSAAEPKPEP
jgi:hypothetical protein